MPVPPAWRYLRSVYRYILADRLGSLISHVIVKSEQRFGPRAVCQGRAANFLFSAANFFQLTTKPIFRYWCPGLKPESAAQGRQAERAFFCCQVRTETASYLSLKRARKSL